MEAALIDPHSIVFFATDGIVSTRVFQDLPRVRKRGDVGDLGDWEYCEADGGLFVLPGVYTYGKITYDETGAGTVKPVTKIRGGDAKKYAAKVKANQWLIENVLAAWRTPFDPHKPERFPRIVAPYQKYITVGNALASRHRWKLAGRWTARPGEPGAGTREISVHTVGNKRELIPDENCWPDYVSIPGREARRCHSLIRAVPALNNDTSLSRPRMPEWMDKNIGRASRSGRSRRRSRRGLSRDRINVATERAFAHRARGGVVPRSIVFLEAPRPYLPIRAVSKAARSFASLTEASGRPSGAGTVAKGEIGGWRDGGTAGRQERAESSRSFVPV